MIIKMVYDLYLYYPSFKHVIHVCMMDFNILRLKIWVWDKSNQKNLS